ncbi:hypothetical protein DFH11DRAFT_1543400 [Phellopilus nigrolimitatus]|nr:hypothetical protein DFH11DRAFT_1543400 [Phellopilus nigrolimitatus]
MPPPADQGDKGDRRRISDASNIARRLAKFFKNKEYQDKVLEALEKHLTKEKLAVLVVTDLPDDQLEFRRIYRELRNSELIVLTSNDNSECRIIECDATTGKIKEEHKGLSGELQGHESELAVRGGCEGEAYPPEVWEWRDAKGMRVELPLRTPHRGICQAAKSESSGASACVYKNTRINALFCSGSERYVAFGSPRRLAIQITRPMFLPTTYILFTGSGCGHSLLHLSPVRQSVRLKLLPGQQPAQRSSAKANVDSPDLLWPSSAQNTVLRYRATILRRYPQRLSNGQLKRGFSHFPGPQSSGISARRAPLDPHTSQGIEAYDVCAAATYPAPRHPRPVLESSNLRQYVDAQESAGLRARAADSAGTMRTPSTPRPGSPVCVIFTAVCRNNGSPGSDRAIEVNRTYIANRQRPRRQEQAQTVDTTRKGAERQNTTCLPVHERAGGKEGGPLIPPSLVLKDFGLYLRVPDTHTYVASPSIVISILISSSKKA